MIIFLILGLLFQTRGNDADCATTGKYHQIVTNAIQSTTTTFTESAQSRLLTEACSIDSLASEALLPTPDKDFSTWLKREQSKRAINDKDAIKIIYQWRMEIVKSVVPGIVMKNNTAKLKPAELVNAVSKDTTNYAVKMSQTDITVSEILTYSSAYSAAAFTSSSNANEFYAFKRRLEKVIVKVLFKSNPEKASVILKNTESSLGQTEFEKSLDSDREYTFLVQKEGYEPIEVKRLIPPSPRNQTISFELKKMDQK